MGPAGFTVLDHPSDVGFRAWGVDLPEAWSQAVAALAHIATGGHPPAPAGRIAVEVEADDDEGRLVGLLDECLYLVDARDWMAVAARLDQDGAVVQGVLLGGPLPDAAREAGVHVKAITWHQLEVRRTPGQVTLTVFVDL